MRLERTFQGTVRATRPLGEEPNPRNLGSPRRPLRVCTRPKGGSQGVPTWYPPIFIPRELGAQKWEPCTAPTAWAAFSTTQRLHKHYSVVFGSIPLERQAKEGRTLPATRVPFRSFPRGNGFGRVANEPQATQNRSAPLQNANRGQGTQRNERGLLPLVAWNTTRSETNDDTVSKTQRKAK